MNMQLPPETTYIIWAHSGYVSPTGQIIPSPGKARQFQSKQDAKMYCLEGDIIYKLETVQVVTDAD